MAHDKQPNEPWPDRPLTDEELKVLRDRLSESPEADLVNAYEAALFMCELNHGVPPQAAFIQQLVATWREMQRRRK